MDNEKFKKSTNPTINYSCIVCNESHSSLKSFLLCINCENPTCKVHSKSLNDLTFCDTCVKKELKSQVQQDFQNSLNSLTSELNSYRQREDTYLSKILKKQSKIDKLEKQIQDTLNQSKSTLNQFKEKLTEQELLNDSEESTKASLSTQLAESEKSTQATLMQFSSTQSDLLKLSNSHKKSNKQIKALRNTVEQLLRDCESSIPYRRLRNTLCNKCHKELKTGMKQEILATLKHSSSKSLLESLYANRSTTQDSHAATPCTCICF